ncbi:MAG: flavin reductase [Pseudomonadota bacterium]
MSGMHLDRRTLDSLPRERGIALVNSLSGFKTAALVGTRSRDGQTNLAVMNSTMHIGARPPLLGLIFRPDTVARHTLENIRATGAYTISHVPESRIEAAHQTSARYPRDCSEFEATGLSEGWWEDFAAPYVAEAGVRIGLQAREELAIASNGTYLVIGEVMQLDCPDDAIASDGGLDPQAAGSVACVGLSSYYRAELVQRLPYAKVAGDTDSCR